MPRRAYQDRLHDLREEVCSMGDLVLDRYDQAIDAYERHDEHLAERVITGDHDVNQRYLGLENECMELLALQQPVAGDLRFITASFKIITDLERVADLATNLARYGRESEGQIHPAIDLETLAPPAREMVTDAVEAYRAEDAEACWEIAERDDQLDAACEAANERIVRDLVDLADTAMTEEEFEELFADVSTALLTVRDLERVGDHAVNVSARTLYMVENDDSLIY